MESRMKVLRRTQWMKWSKAHSCNAKHHFTSSKILQTQLPMCQGTFRHLQDVLAAFFYVYSPHGYVSYPVSMANRAKVVRV